MGQCSSDPSSQEHQNSILNQNQPRRQFNPFYQPNIGRQQQQQILAQYKFHSHYNDKYFSKCDVLEEICTGDLYLLKSITSSNQQEHNKHYQELIYHKNRLTHQNVIQIKHVLNKSTDGLFTQYRKLILIFDYPFINLQREYANRRIKSLEFTKEEYMNILSNSIKGFASLEKNGYINDKIRLRNIFIGIKNKQSILKVPESSFLEMKPNYQIFYQEGLNYKDNYDVYPSPEELGALKRGQNNFKQVNKAGVFSLGMSLIQLGTMSSSRQLYHYDEYKIDEIQTKNKISIIGKRYGGFFQRLLKNMLTFNPYQRPSFIQLEDKMPKLLRCQNQPSSMHVSVVPNRRSQFMINDSKMISSVRKGSISPSNSRIFSSRVKSEKDEGPLQEITQQYTNGNSYIGQKKDGMKHGKGKYIFKDGSYYQGTWKNNKMDGKGDLFFPDGRIQYSGEWKADQFEGWGILNSDNLSWSKYEGQFKRGLKQGRGKLFFKNGQIYDGEFRSNKINGYGRRILPNGLIEDKYWQPTTIL